MEWRVEVGVAGVEGLRDESLGAFAEFELELGIRCEGRDWRGVQEGVVAGGFQRLQPDGCGADRSRGGVGDGEIVVRGYGWNGQGYAGNRKYRFGHRQG